MSKKNDDRKTILIVGGGVAGSAAARQLSAKLDPSKFNLILLNNRPFYIFPFATLRMVASDKDRLEDQILIPFDKLFHNGNGTFKVGTVASLDKKSVLLQDGERIPYDVLILTPGSKWEGHMSYPLTSEEIPAHLKSIRDKIQHAENIAIVGGGAVGIELAGEIKDIYPSKSIKIVQADRLLLNKAYPDKFRKYIEQSVRARGIEVVFNEYVDEIPEAGTTKTFTTRSGTTLSGDLVIKSRGPKPNTEFVASLGSGVLSKDGFIKVQPTLQLVGHDNIFSAGDVIDWEEQKQGAKAANHVAVVVPNVLSYVEGRPLAAKYKGGAEMILVTNGKNGGRTYLGVWWGLMFGDWFSSMMKSKALFISTGRKQMGYA